MVSCKPLLLPLQQAIKVISAKETELEHVATMKQLVLDYQRHSHADHYVTLKRKLYIEAQKEYIERQSKVNESNKI